MANSRSKRFYLALLILICGYLLLITSTYAGMVHADLESEVYTFLLWLLVLLIFFYPSKK